MPNPCVWLAVDTAANSGWCIGDETRVVIDSGEARAMRHAELVEIIRRTIDVAKNQGLTTRHVVLVLEKPWRGRARGRHVQRDQHAVVAGLGGAAFAWRSAWCEAMGTSSPRRVVTVYPHQWRQRVLGLTGGSGLAMRELRTADMWRRECGRPEREVGSDEAASILISRWAMSAGEVRAKLPKARAK